MEGANLGAQGASEAFQMTRSWLDGLEEVDCFISRTKRLSNQVSFAERLRSFILVIGQSAQLYRSTHAVNFAMLVRVCYGTGRA